MESWDDVGLGSQQEAGGGWAAVDHVGSPGRQCLPHTADEQAFLKIWGRHGRAKESAEAPGTLPLFLEWRKRNFLKGVYHNNRIILEFFSTTESITRLRNISNTHTTMLMLAEDREERQGRKKRLLCAERFSVRLRELPFMVSDLTFTKTSSEFPFPWFSAALMKFQITVLSGSNVQQPVAQTLLYTLSHQSLYD